MALAKSVARAPGDASNPRARIRRRIRKRVMTHGISLAVTIALEESFVGCEQAGDAESAAGGVPAGHWVRGMAAGEPARGVHDAVHGRRGG